MPSESFDHPIDLFKLVERFPISLFLYHDDAAEWTRNDVESELVCASVPNVIVYSFIPSLNIFLVMAKSKWTVPASLRKKLRATQGNNALKAMSSEFTKFACLFWLTYTRRRSVSNHSAKAKLYYYHVSYGPRRQNPSIYKKRCAAVKMK